MLPENKLIAFEQALLDMQSQVLGVAEFIDINQPTEASSPKASLPKTASSGAGKTDSGKLDAVKSGAAQHALHQQSMQTTVSPHRMADELPDGQSQQLHLIELCLQRIDDKSYGRCNGCAQWINEDRLQINPIEQYCQRCAEQ